MKLSLLSRCSLCILFCLALAQCYAQAQVKVIGQFTGFPSGEIRSVTITAAFIEKGEQTFPISEYGSFSGTVLAKGNGIATFRFLNYSYEFVLASEPVVRFQVAAASNDQVKISIEDSKENAAYQFARVLMNDQYKMYSYFAGCGYDSCLRMMNIEQETFRHHRDSLIRLYSGTYSAEVLSRFYDFHTPSDPKQLSHTIKSQLLNQTPWGKADVFNSKVPDRIIGLYLTYSPDTGLALRRSIYALLDKTTAGTDARDKLANSLFDILMTDGNEDGLRQFLTLANDTPQLFTDVVLKEKCRRYAKVVSGAKAPEVSLPDANGREVSLQNTAGLNKYTLLLIWNPDCEHCMSSMPAISDAYRKYHPKGFEIYAVSLNQDRKAWLKAVGDKKMNWVNTVVNEENRSQPEQYVITYTPLLVLIDSQGTIIHRQILVGDLETTLRKLF